jgi:hypothetical protein
MIAWSQAVAGRPRARQGSRCARPAPEAASQKRTSLQQADSIAFFHSPTGAHLAPLILPWPGRRSAPRRPCAIPRQTTIQQKLRSTISAAGFAQVSLQSTCRIFGDRTCVMCHQIGLCQTQELRAAVPIVCRTQEWATIRPWYYPVLWIADVSADIAIATRLTLSDHWPSAFQVPLRPITLPTLARRG